MNWNLRKTNKSRIVGFGLSGKMLVLLVIFCLFQSCVITTHSVKEIKTSQIDQPDALSKYTSFKFSSAVKPQKTKDWFRNYLGLDREDDLVNFKSKFLEDSNHEFIITISDYSDKEEYMDLTGLFFAGGVKNREGDLKFFVEITITDKSGVDHLAEDSIFQKPILDKLSEMRNEFQSFTASNPDQKFF